MTGPHPSHEALGDELRAVAGLAADRLAPALERLGPLLDGWREDGPGTPASCAGCPVCALTALLRGERPELAVRWAEHAAALLAVLRVALAEDEGRAGNDPAPPAPARRVQHIRVERPAAS